jgi:hypothetical protein
MASTTPTDPLSATSTPTIANIEVIPVNARKDLKTATQETAQDLIPPGAAFILQGKDGSLTATRMPPSDLKRGRDLVNKLRKRSLDVSSDKVVNYLQANEAKLVSMAGGMSEATYKKFYDALLDPTSNLPEVISKFSVGVDNYTKVNPVPTDMPAAPLLPSQAYSDKGGDKPGKYFTGFSDALIKASSTDPTSAPVPPSDPVEEAKRVADAKTKETSAKAIKRINNLLLYNGQFLSPTKKSNISKNRVEIAKVSEGMTEKEYTAFHHKLVDPKVSVKDTLAEASSSPLNSGMAKLIKDYSSNDVVPTKLADALVEAVNSLGGKVKDEKAKNILDVLSVLIGDNNPANKSMIVKTLQLVKDMK